MRVRIRYGAHGHPAGSIGTVVSQRNNGYVVSVPGFRSTTSRYSPNVWYSKNGVDILTELPSSTPKKAKTPPRPTTITKTRALELISRSGNSIFTVTFIKKDSTRRVMNCRLGVKSALKGGKPSFNAASLGYLRVYDVQSRGYRLVDARTISALSIGNKKYTVK